MDRKAISNFFRLLVTRFNRDRCLSHATDLSFNWLLSVVPLMTVSLAILAAYPEFDEVIKDLQNSFFKYFTPNSASMQQVHNYFVEFSAKATQLTGIGVLFLILTALMLMRSIDNSFNEIWNVQIRRNRVTGFLVYWAVLTIGPLLIGVSFAVTSYLVALPFFSSTVMVVGSTKLLLGLLPIIATCFAFTLMYMVIPNRSVSFKHAVVGGVVAAILFELAKKGFTLYVTLFPTYKFIYGALSTIPIFLIWIYISWVVVLLGAEITHCLSIFNSHMARKSTKNNDLFNILDIIYIISKRQDDGEGMQTREILKDLPLLEEYELLSHLENLKAASVVKRTETGEWVLARSLGSYSLHDLYKDCPSEIPIISNEQDLDNIQYPVLAKILNQNLESTMSMSLEELYANNHIGGK